MNSSHPLLPSPTLRLPSRSCDPSCQWTNPQYTHCPMFLFTPKRVAGENPGVLWLSLTYSCSFPRCWDCQQHPWQEHSPQQLDTCNSHPCTSNVSCVTHGKDCLKQGNIAGLISPAHLNITPVFLFYFPPFPSASMALLPPFMTFNSTF